jgi:hypothetical protein
MPDEVPLGGDVIVGGTRVPVELLDPIFAGIDDPALEAAIAVSVAEHPAYLPIDGRRVLEASEEKIVVGSDGLTGGDWSTISFGRGADGPVEEGITFWQIPRPTPEGRGRGLVMTFADEPLVMVAGTAPHVRIRIDNSTSEPITADAGIPILGSVIGSDGRAVLHHAGPFGVAGVGWDLRVRPSRSVDQTVVFLGCDLNRLGPGVYELRAGIPELALTAVARLEVSGPPSVRARGQGA